MRNSVRLEFLNQFVQRVREVGSVTPDSSACVNGLLKSIRFDSAKTIIEFGAASGAVTRQILRRKRSEATLVCFEKNPAFFDHLRKTIKGKNVLVVRADAFDAVHVLARFGIKPRSVDCIISTLPCSSIRFSELIGTAVLPLLAERGAFVQYMHVVSVLKRFSLKPILSRRFGKVDSEFVFMNVPPVLIYTCRS